MQKNKTTREECDTKNVIWARFLIATISVNITQRINVLMIGWVVESVAINSGPHKDWLAELFPFWTLVFSSIHCI